MPGATSSPSAPVAGGRSERIAKIGTVVSAIMASSCCWLPPLLLAVGVSGAGIASALEAYRPLFIVVTFGFLGMAFYFTYRPRKGACRQGEARSAQAAAPATTAGRPRFNMMALNKAMLWMVTVLAVVFLFFPQATTWLFSTGDATITADMTRTVLTVEGMT